MTGDIDDIDSWKVRPVVEVKPFAGLRYAVDRVGSLGLVTCPPYDVISDEQREELYSRCEYNVVRLVLGKAYDSDDEFDNRYTRAAALLRQWRCDGILRRDPEPALYAYEQLFEVGGNQYTRFGFIAAVGLQDFGVGGILPHEQTLSKPKADRLQLMRATRCNLSPIFGIYSDESGSIEAALRDQASNTEALVVLDDSGTVNRIWAVSDRGAIEAVRRGMQDSQILIADGHHRYETSLNYQREVRQKLGLTDESQRIPSDYTMMMLVNMHGTGLVVLPTHRVIHGLNDLDPAVLVAECAKWFDVEEADPKRLADIEDMTPERFLDSLSGDVKPAADTPIFGLYVAGRLYLLKLRDRSKVESLMDASRSEAWRRLDVSVLHSVIIGHIMNISDEDQLHQKNLKYTRSLREAVSLVDSGQCQVALLLNPTSVDEVRQVALAGETMPQKSTYFYPKLLTGLVLRSLDQEDE